MIFIDCLLQPLKVEHTCLTRNLGFHHLQLRHRVSLKRGKVVKLLTEHLYRLCRIQYSLVFQDCREAFGQEFFESLFLWLLMLRLSQAVADRWESFHGDNFSDSRCEVRLTWSVGISHRVKFSTFPFLSRNIARLKSHLTRLKLRCPTRKHKIWFTLCHHRPHLSEKRVNCFVKTKYSARTSRLHWRNGSLELCLGMGGQVWGLMSYRIEKVISLWKEGLLNSGLILLWLTFTISLRINLIDGLYWIRSDLLYRYLAFEWRSTQTAVLPQEHCLCFVFHSKAISLLLRESYSWNAFEILGMISVRFLAFI